MTYVLTSGWASLSCELMQPFGLLCNLFYIFILRNKDVTTYGTLTFPYHTEVPRILLFGLFGFVYSTLSPLILPFLLVYFSLAYLVYRNQVNIPFWIIPSILLILFYVPILFYLTYEMYWLRILKNISSFLSQQ